jgi:hypothetical protein
MLYAFLQVRRLDRLTNSLALGEERSFYALYPTTSPGFTPVVFGNAAAQGPPTRRIERIASFLTDTLFNWIPVLALLISIVSVIGAAVLWQSTSGVFSTSSIIIGAMLTLIQTIVTVAFQREREAVKNRFAVWTAVPEDPGTTQT